MSFWTLFCCKDANEPSMNLVTNKRVSSVIRMTSNANFNTQEITFVPMNEDKYEGQRLNNVPHGIGVMLYANGDHYHGQWVNGMKQGRGKQIYISGDEYQGQWKNNLPNGKGKWIEKNHSTYEGQFKDGLKNGNGQYFDFEEKKTYSQIYENGKLLEKRQIFNHNKDQQFPTMVLDKERFNTQDLTRFEDANPEIKEFQLEFLLQYYGLCKVINLDFIDQNITQWTIKQVLTFLTEIGLKDYQQIFYKNKIKGKDLLTLTDSQMRDDLKMKLGDRKRLKNYIKYLQNVYKSMKKQTKKKTLKTSKSLAQSRKQKNLFQKLNSVENPIIEQDDEDPNNNDSPTYNYKTDREININKKNYQTENWEQYNSNYVSFQHFMDESKNKKNTDKEQESQEKEEEIYSNCVRKISEDKKSDQQKNGKNEDKYSSSSSSSDQSDNLLVVKKKKSIGHTMEVRELYEFLKEHRGLDFLIKQKDIQIQEQIGEGGYGKVYKGRYMSCPVAVKDYLKPERVHKSQDDFMKQVDIMSDLKHPNIVLYMGIHISANKYQLVTQFMENGSLFDQLHTKSKKKFTQYQQFQIVNDIVMGMVYLHYMKNLMHRDLKSSNVLLDDDYKVKLCDFGLSGHKRKKKKKNNRIGTYQWMAPQVIRNEQIDFPSDVYSFGVIIWEILTQKIPYDGLSEAQVRGLVGHDKQHKLQAPQNADPLLVSIMDKCLQKQPKDRPTFMEIQEDIIKKLRKSMHQNPDSHEK